MHKALLFSKLCLLFLLASFYSKADTCLPDVEGLCTPGVTIDEQVTVEKTEEDKGTEIIFTTTTTKTTTTTTVTNEDSGDILDGSKYKTEYVEANKPEPKEFTDAQSAALFKAMFIVLTGIVLF